jgi:hypothetical protein
LGGECKKASEILKNCHQPFFDHDIAIEGKNDVEYFYQTRKLFRKTKNTVKSWFGVNFSNILHVIFMCADPKSAKNDSKVIRVFLHFWDLCA